MMYCTCDGCGRIEPCYHNGMDYVKPLEWYCRTPRDEKRTLHACCYDCMELAESKPGDAAAEGRDI